jgi:hypothetical protein
MPSLDGREAASDDMLVLLLPEAADPAIAETAKAVAAIGLVPTLLVIALYAYKSRSDATIKYLEEQNKKLLDEILRTKKP